MGKPVFICVEQCQTVGYKRLALRASGKKMFGREQEADQKNKSDEGRDMKKNEGNQISFDEGGKYCYTPISFELRFKPPCLYLVLGWL